MSYLSVWVINRERKREEKNLYVTQFLGGVDKGDESQDGRRKLTSKIDSKGTEHAGARRKATTVDIPLPWRRVGLFPMISRQQQRGRKITFALACDTELNGL